MHAATAREHARLLEGSVSRVEPSQARYRSAVAMARLAKALGIQLLPEAEDCECLERLAKQAERWRILDNLRPEDRRTATALAMSEDD